MTEMSQRKNSVQLICIRIRWQQW